MLLSDQVKRSGFVAIVGRPNVGKSSLLNKIIGRKIVITSHQPQTTRHQIQGIKTTETTQTIYVDTPGMHLGGKKALNTFMNKTARASLIDVDAVIFVVEAGRWTKEDEMVLECVKNLPSPVFLAINKIDTLKDKSSLLPYISDVSSKMSFEDIIPISALKIKQIDILENRVNSVLPEGVFYFPVEQIVNRGERFQLAEIMREQLMRTLAQELPHETTVEIEAMGKEGDQYQIAAIIWVERESQKPIVIGEKGQRLKQMGIEARQAMSAYLNAPVYLKTWVKVKNSWSDDARMLKSLGYDDE